MEYTQGNVMITVRDVKRPVSGQTTGQRLLAVAFNNDATDFEGRRIPSIAKKYIIREALGSFDEAKVERFIARYFANARIHRI